MSESLSSVADLALDVVEGEISFRELEDRHVRG
jgi:hypothetical protein